MKKLKCFYNSFLFLLVVFFCLSFSLHAEKKAEALKSKENSTEESKEKKEEKKKIEIKPGIVASFGSGGAGGYQISTVVDTKSLTDTNRERPPLSASVAPLADYWQVNVTNNSDSSVTAFFSFVQTNAKGKNIRSNAFTASLKPKDSYSRRFPKKSSASGAYLKLIKAKIKD